MCSADDRDVMNDDEDAEGLSSSRSLDLLAHTSVSWVRGNKRSQILPDGKYTSTHLTLLSAVII